MGADIGRNSALDFTKGVLVLLMLLYHWVNYFVGTDGLIYTYLRFITPSFIFITGFLISSIYPTKHGFDYLHIFWRLLQRGIKLLVIFTALNVLANLLFATNYRGQMPGIEGFFGRAADIYISGNAKSLFWVLLPIGYFLPIAGGLFLICRDNRLLLHGICCLAVLWVAASNFWSVSSANLEMLGVGVLGLVCGMYPINKLNRVFDHPLALGTLYLAYTVAIAIWGVPYVLQLVGVCLNVALIYMTGIRRLIMRTAYDRLVMLGQYSLFGYVAQIGILHFLRQLMDHFDFPSMLVWGISFMIACGLTVATVIALDAARKKSAVVKRTYEAVFA
jgi:hypothetical protein